jgi:hypothetical protein
MSEFAAASGSNSSGALFNFAYGAGIPLNQIDSVVKGANRASAAWSSYLKDNVGLNTQIEFVDLPDGVIGGSRPAMVKVNYKDFVAALFDDQTSSQDWTVLNNLSLDAKDWATLQNYTNGSLDPSKVKFGTRAFSLYLDGRFNPSTNLRRGAPFVDNNGNENNQKIWLTRANAKALGLINPNDGKLDAIVQLDRSTQWDFDPSDGISPGTYDFTSVLAHEMGHVLGFVSGVDAFEFLTLTQTTTLSDKNLTYVSPMDMFRYSEQSARAGVIDMRIGGGIEKFFSLDGGKTKLADFSIGGTNVGGDGYQSSHWKFLSEPLGIMQPNLQPGQSLTITALDLTLLDAIGWDLKSPLSEKAAAIGVDWDQFSQAMSQRQRRVINTLAKSWEDQNPGYSIASDLREQANRLNFGLNQEIEKELDHLTKKIAPIRDPDKRAKEIQATLDKIQGLQERQDAQLAKFVKEREKLDVDIRKWLDLDAKKLSEQLETAIGVEILKLSNLVNNATGSQRTTWEAKLMNAFSYLTDNPSTAVKEVLKTSGPRNPLGWRSRYWGWTQTGAEDTSVNILNV